MYIYIYYHISITGGDYNKPTSHLISAGKTLHGQPFYISSAQGRPLHLRGSSPVLRRSGSRARLEDVGRKSSNPMGFETKLN